MDVVYCQHGKLLYECDDLEHSTPHATPSRMFNATYKPIPRWEGKTEVYLLITDKSSDVYGGSQILNVTCGHLHKTRDAADSCVERKAEKYAREYNRANKG